MKSVIKLIIKIVFLIVIFLSIIFIYSKYINPVGFKVKEYTLHDKQLSEEFDGLKIVHISDIHYGVTINKNELRKIVKQINLTKPDIVLLTGDLLDKSIKYKKEDIKTIQELLKEIDSTIDKYYITGDNDYQSKDFDSVITDTDFICLDDNYKIIYKNNSSILISGLSTQKNKNDHKINATIDYLKKNNIYSILILHEPDELKNINYSNLNLILAGHSLGGQIRLPFIGGIIRKKGSKKYVNGYYKINTTNLYVSNGLGNENIKYRTLNKPSFNLFRLRYK